MRIDLGYPSRGEEVAILERFQEDDPLESLAAVLSPERIRELQKLRACVVVCAALKAYIADIAAETRSHRKVRFGVSPRGAIGMMKASQALAVIRGRDFVLPDDIKELARPVLLHRLILKHEERTRGASAQEVLDEVLARVPVPVTD
jgi:MoxR-like ATPase